MLDNDKSETHKIHMADKWIHVDLFAFIFLELLGFCKDKRNSNFLKKKVCGKLLMAYFHKEKKSM